MTVNAYFSDLNQQLRNVAHGRPAILIDLDRLDHNLNVISEVLGERLRVVTKSLPSTELLAYILGRTGCKRLMVFHQPYLPYLLRQFPDVDILLGKPLLAAGVAEILALLADDERDLALHRVQWLADTPQSLEQLGKLATEAGVRLNVNIEIDIGLRRGGIGDDFGGMARVFDAFPDQLNWRGLMGYDAHVPYLGEDISAAFREVMMTYRRLHQAATGSRGGRGNTGPLTLNSGGSQTYALFGDEGTVVNDVSVGSAFLKPARFDRLTALQPALFIAAPTLKQFPRPTRSTVSYVYGGGWPGEIVWPDGAQRSDRDDAPNENLMPNQSVILKPGQSDHSIGDHVFFRPHQSDAMFQFETIYAFRGGRLVERWHPIPIRY